MALTIPLWKLDNLTTHVGDAAYGSSAVAERRERDPGSNFYNEDGGGLREVFESTAVIKIGYDGRANFDALFHLFGTRMNKFYDVQIASCMRQDAEQGRKDRFVHMV